LEAMTLLAMKVQRLIIPVEVSLPSSMIWEVGQLSPNVQNNPGYLAKNTPSIRSDIHHPHPCLSFPKVTNIAIAINDETAFLDLMALEAIHDKNSSEYQVAKSTILWASISQNLPVHGKTPVVLEQQNELD
jgi:hypothetical protein